MTKITVEMEDNLSELVADTVEEAKEQLLSLLEVNADVVRGSTLINRWRHNGSDHELVDGMVPIYTKEIDDLYYLHGDKMEEAYRNAGVGDGSEDNHKAVAIFYYLEQEMYREIDDWADEIVDEVQEYEGSLDEELDLINTEIEDLTEEFEELDEDDEDTPDRKAELKAEIETLRSKLPDDEYDWKEEKVLEFIRNLS